MDAPLRISFMNRSLPYAYHYDYRMEGLTAIVDFSLAYNLGSLY